MPEVIWAGWPAQGAHEPAFSARHPSEPSHPRPATRSWPDPRAVTAQLAGCTPANRTGGGGGGRTKPGSRLSQQLGACSAVRLSTAGELIQVGSRCHGGTHVTTRHAIGPLRAISV